MIRLRTLPGTARSPGRFTDEDVGDGCSLHGAVPGEGVAWRLANHVVWVADVGGVVQLGHGNVYPGSLRYWLQRNEVRQGRWWGLLGLTT